MPPRGAEPDTRFTTADIQVIYAMVGAELKAALVEAASTPNVKAPTIKAIEEWLYHERLISMKRFPKKGFYYVPTPAGVDAGLRSVDRVTASGMPYSVLDYTPDAQRLVVEHFIKMKPEENSST